MCEKIDKNKILHYTTTTFVEVDELNSKHDRKIIFSIQVRYLLDFRNRRS